MSSRPIYLAEIVQREPTDLGFIDASDMGAGGVLIDPNQDGNDFVWRV